MFYLEPMYGLMWKQRASDAASLLGLSSASAVLARPAQGERVSAEKEEPHVVVEHMRRHLGQSLTGFQGGIQA